MQWFRQVLSAACPSLIIIVYLIKCIKQLKYDGEAAPASTHIQPCTEIDYVTPEVMQLCTQESCKVATQTNGASHDKFQAAMTSYATGEQLKLACLLQGLAQQMP